VCLSVQSQASFALSNLFQSIVEVKMCPSICSHAIREALSVHFWLGLLEHLLPLAQPSVLIICALLETGKKTDVLFTRVQYFHQVSLLSYSSWKSPLSENC
jgi:hypothetical protein